MMSKAITAASNLFRPVTTRFHLFRPVTKNSHRVVSQQGALKKKICNMWWIKTSF